jgi:hypothetical protein
LVHEPTVTLVGLAENELINGLGDGVTVNVHPWPVVLFNPILSVTVRMGVTVPADM